MVDVTRYEFSLTLGGSLDLGSFLHAIEAVAKLLRASDPQHFVRWRVETLRRASPAIVGLVGEPRSPRCPPDAPATVGGAVLAGLRDLERGARPSAFREEMLLAASRLAELRGRAGIESVTVSDSATDSSPVAITQHVSATVDDMIGVRFESLGAVEGRLQVVSTQGGVLRCNIYERLRGQAVRCDVDATLKKLVLELFDQEVVATGVVKRDGSGVARRIELHDIQARRIQETFVSLAGIATDFTDGEDTVAYLRGRWQ